jgi:hypothetical protein
VGAGGGEVRGVSGSLGQAQFINVAGEVINSCGVSGSVKEESSYHIHPESACPSRIGWAYLEAIHEHAGATAAAADCKMLMGVDCKAGRCWLKNLGSI